jgi:deoxyribodipyrimidine photo-lyase
MSSTTLDSALVWFRRDLRADDHAALYHALKGARRVFCAFVFDRDILDPLLARGLHADRRVEFIHESVVALDEALCRLAHGQGGLIVRHAVARQEIARLAAELHVQAVYCNHDDEPFSRDRDAHVRGALADHGITLHTSKDQVIFERDEVLSASGTSYSVFTPYRDAWLAKIEPFYLRSYAVDRHAAALAPVPDALRGVPTLHALGFQRSNLQALKLPCGSAGASALLAEFLTRIDHYQEARDYPALKGPSYLGVHLRFGSLSIRRAAREAWQRTQAGSRGAQSWLSEIIWREFFQQLLWHHPHVIGHAFRPRYDALRWEHGKHAEEHFAAWCAGRTGYPLVDAAMTQLNQTGYMHNRLRMVAASFLVKDLGIDWRRGEAYFADHLNDFELASNNGGWQWVASTGCDAQPWFRIFNPVRQSETFDAEGRFIRRYLSQLARLPNRCIHAPWTASPIELQAAGVVLGRDYPRPIVRHEEARERTLRRYAAVK